MTTTLKLEVSERLELSISAALGDVVIPGVDYLEAMTHATSAGLTRVYWSALAARDKTLIQTSHRLVWGV